MTYLFAIFGIFIIFAIIWDAFETIVLPRRVTRRFRLARGFYRITWIPWLKIARYFPSNRLQETYLGFYGPLSLIFIMIFWATGLIIGFALFDFGMNIAIIVSHGPKDFITYLYASGTTFFTLGLGDVYPAKHIGRISFVIEAGTGFTFLAIIIGYLPTLYQAFSHRETQITMLDARAGSPPNALFLLKIYAGENMKESLLQLLENWEIWCADLLETHLSYPILAYYRSQHENESWISAIATMLDVSALIMVGIDGIPAKQARFTFAVARHAVVDLTQVFHLTPQVPLNERLSDRDLKKLREILKKKNVNLKQGKKADAYLKELRSLYEPYLQVLSLYFFMPFQPFIPPDSIEEAWKRTPWKKLKIKYMQETN
jgi:ion channel